MIGDILARGGKSAQFPSLSHVSVDKWESIFGKRPLNISKPVDPPKKNVAKKQTRKAS